MVHGLLKSGGRKQVLYSIHNLGKLPVVNSAFSSGVLQVAIHVFHSVLGQAFVGKCLGILLGAEDVLCYL